MAVIYVTDLPYDFDAFLDDVVQEYPLLSYDEEELVDDLIIAYDQYGGKVVVTDVQIEMLDKIREKIY